MARRTKSGGDEGAANVPAQGGRDGVRCEVQRRQGAASAQLGQGWGVSREAT